MKKRGKALGKASVVGAAVLLLFLGCATGSRPRETGAPGESPPPWVLSTPAGDARYEYFVGSSSDPAKDAARAEEQAVYALIAEITRYIGVTITAETTSEAKAALDSFQAQVTQQVRQTGSARVTGLRVADKYVLREASRVTVYVLAQYDRAELQKERDRIAAVFKEQADAVAVPEETGKRLAASGDLFGAIKSFIQAAAAASGSNIDNAAIKFERNINNAKAVINRIGLVPLSGAITGEVGSPLPGTFQIKVVDGQRESDPPIRGADIQVSYKEARTGGRVGIRAVNLQSGADGRVEFEHPIPTFVGSEKVTMMLDLSAFLVPLEKAPRAFAPQVSGLQDLVSGKRVSMEYNIVSRARKIPTGIVVLDTDGASNPTGTTGTGSGILEALSSDGFQVRTLSFNAVSLRGMSDTEVIRAVAAAHGGQVERVVFGVITVDELEEAKGSFQVRVAGTVKAADLKTGQILYSKRMFKRGIGSSSGAVISTAFRNLGVDFGKDLSRNLP